MKQVKTHFQLSLAAVFLVWVVPCQLQADMIVGYEAANSPDTSPATDWLSGVTPLALSRGEGLGAGSGSTFNSSGWTDEATDYLQWGWTGSPPLHLTDLDLRYDRSASGPATLDILLSVNNGPFISVYTDAEVDTNGEDVLDVDLSSYTNVTAATFRLFGMGASSGGGTFDIEPIGGVTPPRGIVVNGIAAVPEPSSVSMLGIATLATAVLSRQRWRNALSGQRSQ